MLVTPVIKQLRTLVMLKLRPVKKSIYLNKVKVLNFLKFRSSLFKFFIYKNFSLYKFLYIDFYKFNFSFFNYYYFDF